MKIGPQSDFPVWIIDESDELREDQANHSLYHGIYKLVLNHMVDLYLVPSVEQKLLTYDEIVAVNPIDMETVEGARAQSAWFANVAVTPHAELAGQDVVVPITGIPANAEDLAGEEVALLYVSPEDYEELNAEVSSILDSNDESSGLEDSLKARFNNRHNSPTINEIGHLKIGQLLKDRVLQSTIVDTQMLRSPLID